MFTLEGYSCNYEEDNIKELQELENATTDGGGCHRVTHGNTSTVDIKQEITLGNPLVSVVLPRCYLINRLVLQHHLPALNS